MSHLSFPAPLARKQGHLSFFSFPSSLQDKKSRVCPVFLMSWNGSEFKLCCKNQTNLALSFPAFRTMKT